MNKRTFSLLTVFSLITAGLFTTSWIRIINYNLAVSLEDTPVVLDIPAIAQSQATSCGEAVIVMAYNFAYPQTPIHESEVIQYASEKGYFTDLEEPFTSPANMVKIARHYTSRYESDVALNSDLGLALLLTNLKNGNPVIIDVLTYLDDPTSSAHFILVTGISMSPEDPDLILVHYNNPLTGQSESAPWGGETGIWNAWQNNSDPGGPGWWLVIDANL
jgi:hypothetical protein